MNNKVPNWYLIIPILCIVVRSLQLLVYSAFVVCVDDNFSPYGQSIRCNHNHPLEHLIPNALPLHRFVISIIIEISHSLYWLSFPISPFGFVDDIAFFFTFKRPQVGHVPYIMSFGYLYQCHPNMFITFYFSFAL